MTHLTHRRTQPFIVKDYRSFLFCQKRELRRAYYAAISFMDHQVGRVLSAIEDAGQADNTVVMFIGDHGLHVRIYDSFQSLRLSYKGWGTFHVGKVYSF